MKRAEDIVIETIKCEDDGSIPNNPYYQLLLYKGAIEPEDSPKEILKNNNWLGIWENGVLPYHHYHSTSHEVLAVSGGTATIQFGGEKGEQVEVEKGDVAILPAGYGHKRIESSSDFAVIGAYPNGRDYDTGYGYEEERPQNLEEIKEVPLPEYDPVYGETGPLFSYWTD